MKEGTLFLMLAGLLLFPACSTLEVAGPSQENRFVFMASTIGPIDAGIVGALEEGFERETGYRVRHVGAGTGAVLRLAEQGPFDLVLAHAKALEEAFVRDGFGTERIPLMYNDYVILGPASDPAGIKGMRKAGEAMRRIAAQKAPFVSRGDTSDTHVAEMELWKGVGIQPSGSWYVVYEKGSAGDASTLRYTNQRQAYTVIDRATYLALKKGITLAIQVQNDEALLNVISLIPVNPAKFPRVNRAGAMKFIGWMTDPDKGQLLIRDFGKDKYGSPLYFPHSEAWRKRQGK